MTTSMKNSCRYGDMIRLYEFGEDIPSGFVDFVFDRDGNTLSSLSKYNPLARNKKRIAVCRDFMRSVGDAAEKLKARFEPKLFTTDENIDFQVDMRLRIDPTDLEGIARAHWHLELGPEDLFYRFFAEEMRVLLEDSAESHPGSIDQRISHFKNIWKPRLEKKLSERFKIGVELRFLVEDDVQSDEPFDFGGQEDPLHVFFVDRIDGDFPLKLSLRLRADDTVNSTMVLKRDKNGRRGFIRAIIRKVCEEEVTLYDYWFDRATCTEKISTGLSRALRDYGYKVQSLVINHQGSAALIAEDASDAAVARNAPNDSLGNILVRSQKLGANIPWVDSYGQSLEFRAEAILEISPDGAGLYDREGRPNLKNWFETTISDCLKHVLAGNTVASLDEKSVTEYKNVIEDEIKRRSKNIGSIVNLFIGDIHLPNQKWLHRQSIQISAATYETAHPNIAAEFSMELQIQFENSKAIVPFVRSVDEKDENSVDTAIRTVLMEIAQNAASLVMKRISADDYFAGFSTWNTAISGLSAPAGVKESGENLVRQELESRLHEKHPGIVFHDIVFHRVDSVVEELRNKIGGLKKIKYECEIHDLGSHRAGDDWPLTGSVDIKGGDPESVVDLLHRKIQKETLEELQQSIRDDLIGWTKNSLSVANISEIISLSGSLTAVGSQLRKPVVEELREFLKVRLKQDHGLIAGNIDFNVSLSRNQIEIREQGDFPLEIYKKETTALQNQLVNLYDELEKLTETDPDSLERRNQLVQLIDETKQRLTDGNSELTGSKGGNLYDQAKLSNRQMDNNLKLLLEKDTGSEEHSSVKDISPDANHKVIIEGRPKSNVASAQTEVDDDGSL